MITITLTDGDALRYLESDDESATVALLTEKLEKTTKANIELQRRLDKVLSPIMSTAGISKDHMDDSKRLHADIKKEKPMVFKKKDKASEVPKNFPLEPFMRDLIMNAVGKQTSTTSIKYLAGRSAKSVTTFRKALKMMGLQAKGGFICQ